MINILVVYTQESEGIKFYRSETPFKILSKDSQTDYPFSVVLERNKDVNIHWKHFQFWDLVFISNPTTDTDVEIVNAAKKLDIPVWIDFDDDYLGLPKDSDPGKIAIKHNVVEKVRWFIHNADQVTVSVEYLKEQTDKVKLGAVVIPNAFPLHYLNDKILFKPEAGIHKFVNWRGANSLHPKNINGFKNQLGKVGLAHPDWKFMFFGQPIPNYMFEEIGFIEEKNYQFHRGDNDIIYYLTRMQAFRSKIHIVPLIDDTFNHSKSMIAWMEGTIAGSAVLAPAWKEWIRPGIINYHTPEHFGELLNEMIEDRYDLQAHFKESISYIQQNLSLRLVNNERLKIIRKLLLK